MNNSENSKPPSKGLFKNFFRKIKCNLRPKRNVLLIGPPGAGKGTQAARLKDEYCYCQLSTGDLLRSEIRNRTSLGLKIKGYMDKGELVPDELAIDLIKAAIRSEKCKKGIIFDGYPRNFEQAKVLDSILSADNDRLHFAIQFNIDETILVERIVGRRVHESSGRVYHLQYNPPLVEGIDDVTHEPIIQRIDDTKEVLQKRLQIYNKVTKPIIEYYQKKGVFSKINANQPIDAVWEELNHLMQNRSGIWKHWQIIQNVVRLNVKL